MKKIKKNLAIKKKLLPLQSKYREGVLNIKLIERRVAGVVNGAVC